jgi:5-methylthioribose kinase
VTLDPNKSRNRPLETPAGYRALDDVGLPAYLAEIPTVADKLGGAPPEWLVREVGDGNLNLVFIVTGPRGGVAVKQALPYVRLVGESWPLPLSRAFFEHEALVAQAAAAPAQTPAIHHHDAAMALTVMELLRPHVIMRKGLAAGIRYPKFAHDVAHFMAHTLFHTSDLALPAAEKKRRIAVFCGNIALCKITEDLIFTDPYRVAELNRWTSPQLDGIAAEFRADTAAKAAVSELKGRFLNHAEAMIHGDLHTGSIMVTATETKVIDPEFAFYGPMGFDIGAVIGNLLLAYFAQPGHATAADPREDYGRWILDQVTQVWTKFEGIFLGLWRDHATGDLYPADLFADPAGQAALRRVKADYMERLFSDSIGFAAAKMIRRILGLAHIEELETIADLDLRADCETRALRLARDMLVNRSGYRRIGDVTASALAHGRGVPEKK